MKKIAIVGDVHLGKVSSDQTRRDAIERGQDRFFEWLASDLKRQGITQILFTGDVFDHRTQLNIRTMCKVKELFKSVLGDFEVFIVQGNHDLYYKNSYDYTALSLISDLPNVTVVERTVKKFELLGKDWYFVPWVIEENEDGFREWLGKLASRSDDAIANTVIFGHFELNGVCMEGNTYAKHGMDMAYLLRAARLTLSGHYHGKSYASHGPNELIYVGSPYQLTFVNSGEEHGYYTLDENLEYEFIENSVSPRFINIRDTDGVIPDDLSTAFVNVYYDSNMGDEKFVEFKSAIDGKKPITREFIPYTVRGADVEIDYSEYAGDEEDISHKLDLRELTKVVIRLDDHTNRDINSIMNKVDKVFDKFLGIK